MLVIGTLHFYLAASMVVRNIMEKKGALILGGKKSFVGTLIHICIIVIILKFPYFDILENEIYDETVVPWWGWCGFISVLLSLGIQFDGCRFK